MSTLTLPGRAPGTAQELFDRKLAKEREAFRASARGEPPARDETPGERTDKAAHQRAVLARRERSRAALAKCAATWPKVFDASNPLPIAIASGEQIAALFGGYGHGVRSALIYWTSSIPYLRALAKPGSQRHALDGSVVEPVSDRHRASAAQRLAEAIRRAAPAKRRPKRAAGRRRAA